MLVAYLVCMPVACANGLSSILSTRLSINVVISTNGFIMHELIVSRMSLVVQVDSTRSGAISGTVLSLTPSLATVSMETLV